MSTQNTLITSILIILLVLNSISAHPHSFTGSGNTKLVARDAITLSTDEARNVRKFINSIPRLKSLQTMDAPPKPELLGCVEGLIGNISEVHGTLKRLRHLRNSPTLLSDAHSLTNAMGQIVSFGMACHIALRDFDRIIMLMLTRKLLDLALNIDDVVYRVSQLEWDLPRPATAAINP